ncbi:MAG: DNA-formamidopyrimidine glycosylase family protein [Candidatus Thorarchaeota archaeon]
MSIELPEIEILSKQMNEIMTSKSISDVRVENYEKLQNSSFFNKDTTTYSNLVGCKIREVTGRGTVIRIRMDKERNLLLAPEMGGELRLFSNEADMPKKYHLRVDFTDGSIFSIYLKGYGLVYASNDSNLSNVYSYNRDFLNGVSPLEEDYTLDYVKRALEEKDRNLKTLLVGKEAIVVGYGNAGFQEIAFDSGIHPKRKSSTLSITEKKALFKAIRRVTDMRIKQGGKDSFTDLFGNKGNHVPLIGGHLRDMACPKCGTIIERLMFGGGPTYLCPSCQI